MRNFLVILLLGLFLVCSNSLCAQRVTARKNALLQGKTDNHQWWQPNEQNDSLLFGESFYELFRKIVIISQGGTDASGLWTPIDNDTACKNLNLQVKLCMYSDTVSGRTLSVRAASGKIDLNIYSLVNPYYSYQTVRNIIFSSVVADEQRHFRRLMVNQYSYILGGYFDIANDKVLPDTLRSFYASCVMFYPDSSELTTSQNYTHSGDFLLAESLVNAIFMNTIQRSPGKGDKFEKYLLQLVAKEIPSFAIIVGKHHSDMASISLTSGLNAKSLYLYTQKTVSVLMRQLSVESRLRIQRTLYQKYLNYHNQKGFSKPL